MIGYTISHSQDEGGTIMPHPICSPVSLGLPPRPPITTLLVLPSEGSKRKTPR